MTTFAPLIPSPSWTRSLTEMRIGIFGGAFDPPHVGHEKALFAFLEGASLDLVYVIPSRKAPHKTISDGATEAFRLEMTRRAFLPLSEKVRVSDMELCREGVSYSYLTLQSMMAMHPDDSLFLYVGTDQFLAFETWKNFPEILSSCTLCVMDRYDDPNALVKKREQLEKDFGAQLLILQEKPYIISSTRIREELAKNGFSDALCPDVNDLVFENELYGVALSPKKKRLYERLKKSLGEARLAHTLSVMRCCLTLCDLLGLAGEEKETLSLAALYHDLTKEWDETAHRALLKAHGESCEILDFPAVVHGFTAALLAEEDGLPLAGVNAVRYHTTGRAGMTREEKILYFADYIEERRVYEPCQKARRAFFDRLPREIEARWAHLDACLLSVMEDTAVHLAKTNKPVCPLGAYALADLKRKLERN